MQLPQELRGLVQRMAFDEWFDLQISRSEPDRGRRILFCRTAPVAAGGGVKGHQVRQANFNFLRRESDDGQISAEIEQTERGDLACCGAAHFENLQRRAGRSLVVEKLRTLDSELFLVNLASAFNISDAP